MAYTDLSLKYESGGNPGAINPDDNGSPSYGLFQLHTESGTTASYMNYLSSSSNPNDQAIYNRLKDKDPMTPSGAGSFGDEWKAIGNESGPAFTDSQTRFTSAQYYDPVVEAYPQVSSCNDGVKAALFSGSIQHGVGGNGNLIDKALAANGGSFEPQDKFLDNYYAERSKSYPSEADRYRRELVDAKSLAAGGSVDGAVGSNTSGGTTVSPLSTAVPVGWGDKIIKAAQRYTGLKYRDGGTGDGSIDDGNLVLLAFKACGVDLGQSVPALQQGLCQSKNVFFKSKGQAVKGDIVFFFNTIDNVLAGQPAAANVNVTKDNKLTLSKANAPSNDSATHVGIYMGANKFIHAYQTTGVAECEFNDYFTQRILGFGRMTPDTAKPTTVNAANKQTAAALLAATPIPNEEGYAIKRWAHGKHQDVGVKKKPKTSYEDARKTYCEPMYPDLITVIGELPTWVLDQLKIDKKDMTLGENMVYSISNETLEKTYGINLAEFLGDSKAVQERQVVFNSKEFIKRIKEASVGKPVNNNDPYPVDSKADELFTHQPRVKIEKIEMCGPSEIDVQLAQEIIGVSDRTEKRVVKLENILGVVMRNLWRMAARMPVNCVYYGGQSIYQKYCSIRCTHDDRIRDGQCMSLDQCMCCTRYEPIIGQVYDIYNEQGINLKNVLDDNQMSYMDMKDYVSIARVEEFATPRPKAKIDTSLIKSRDKNEKDFKEVWPAGTKMDWALTPVEDQKSSVNPRQDISGRNSQSTASSYSSNQTKPGTLKADESMYAIMKKNYEAMTGSSSKYAARASSMAGEVDAFMSAMATYGFESDLSKIAGANSIDPLLVAAICVVESTGNVKAGCPDNNYWGLMQAVKSNILAANGSFADANTSAIDQAKTGLEVGCRMYREKASAVGTTNPVLTCIGYNAGEGLVLGCTGAQTVPQLDQTPVSKNMVWANKDAWLWTEVVDALEDNVRKAFPDWNLEEKCSYFPKVCGAYMELKKKMKTSVMASPDGKYTFPFAQSDLGNVCYTSKFGNDRGTHMHAGVDLFSDDASEGMKILAVSDGTVAYCNFQEGGAGNYCLLRHGDGLSSQYMHMSSFAVSAGQVVKAGDVLGYMGSTGRSSGPHLHFEIGRNDCANDSDMINPESIFPMLIGNAENDGYYGTLAAAMEKNKKA